MYCDFAWLLAHFHINLGAWGCEEVSLHAEAGPHGGCDVQQVPVPGSRRPGIPVQGRAAALPAAVRSRQLLCWEYQPGCPGSG